MREVEVEVEVEDEDEDEDDDEDVSERWCRDDRQCLLQVVYLDVKVEGVRTRNTGSSNKYLPKFHCRFI